MRLAARCRRSALRLGLFGGLCLCRVAGQALLAKPGHILVGSEARSTVLFARSLGVSSEMFKPALTRKRLR